jgi:hypothetical protein
MFLILIAKIKHKVIAINCSVKYINVIFFLIFYYIYLRSYFQYSSSTHVTVLEMPTNLQKST